MTLDLLEKIFQNLEMNLTLEEAKEKARLFFKCVKDYNLLENLQENYWIQISREWDLQIEGDFYTGNGWEMTIYECYKNKDGIFSTQTVRYIHNVSIP